MLSVTKVLGKAAFAAGLAFASLAHAEQAPSPAVSADFDGAEVMSLDDLSELSGGTALENAILTDQTLLALVQGNRVSGYIVGSGDIRLGSNAFTGFEGIGNFVLNTGHNNALQSSMNVSILVGGE